ncbi:hypothetical protein PO909_026553 [Leuciscus waleckii]
MTVLAALNTSRIFRIEKGKKKNIQKEILIQRSNGKDSRAAVKTDFPCCLIEEDETLDITFIQKDGNSSTNQQTTADPSLLQATPSKPETLVTFLVEKEGGPTVTCLLKSKALRESVRYVCVFAFKGEEVKTALKRDGRFNDVVVISDNNQTESQDDILRDQFKDLLKTLQQRENLKNKSEVLKFIKEEYQKSVENFLVVKKVKQLMRLSDAVCQIRVEGSPIGTGFLLFDRFILTNAHVIGEFDPFSKKLSKTFTAVFGYEDLEANETKCVPIKEQVAAYYYGKDNMGRYLDFALLELKATVEIANGPGLLSRYIHGEGVKKMDPCFIIERENLQEAADKHASENHDFIHVMTQQSLAEKWENHDNKIHYDSCFFHGSSGSPVFDEHCYLIGVHTGGYVYPGAKQQIKSIVEYAYSMQPILESIITQAKKSERSDILKLLS